MEINKKIRSKKLNIGVDLTAMVSVSFLLIIFFMVNRELAKPKLMPLSLPLPFDSAVYENIGCYNPDGNRIITLLLDKNNKIISYHGLINFPISSPKKLNFGKEIRDEINLKNKQINEYMASKGRPDTGAIFIIKPTNKSNFKNLVDILDEMAIANIKSYSIVNDFIPEETALLVSN